MGILHLFDFFICFPFSNNLISKFYIINAIIFECVILFVGWSTEFQDVIDEKYLILYILIFSSVFSGIALIYVNNKYE